MEQQVYKSHYDFSGYGGIERFSSYWHQLNQVLKLKPNSILEIGVGDKVFANYIKNNTDIAYTSIDIAEDLKPDVVGDVEKMPFADNFFDVVCAFELLEHLPFNKLNSSLVEMKRVAIKNIVISVPHWGRHFAFEIRLPFFKKIRWQKKFSLFPIEHKFNGQHYWEIGKKGYSLKKIKAEIAKAGLKIEKDYIAFESPYHHFFILSKD